MKTFKFLPVFWGLILMCSCAMIDSPVKNSTADRGASSPRVYYAGIYGLELHSGCGLSSPTIAQLDLYEKVLRYKVERGMAYVRVPGSGQTGWIRNASLIWRIPAKTKNDPSAKAVKSASPQDSPKVDPAPSPDTEKQDASMFDAF